jgi:hypothetical protein
MIETFTAIIAKTVMIVAQPIIYLVVASSTKLQKPKVWKLTNNIPISLVTSKWV